jgi:hypothetical protein
MRKQGLVSRGVGMWAFERGERKGGIGLRGTRVSRGRVFVGMLE